MKDINLPNPEDGKSNRCARFLPAVVFGLRAAALAGVVVTAVTGLAGAFDVPAILADPEIGPAPGQPPGWPPDPSTCCF
jgi:hypothetical protein